MLASLLFLLLAPVPVYVGPPPAGDDGFVEADSGVKDSIADVRAELKARKDLRLVDTVAEARVLLYVVGRDASEGDAAVAVNSSGNMTTYVPLEQRRLRVLLKVGDYERQMERSGASWWRGLAKDVVRDVGAWVEANRAKLD